jgi:serine protease
MRSQYLTFLLIATVILNGGCGGKNSSSTRGALRGRVVIASETSESLGGSVAKVSSRVNFAKVAPRRRSITPVSVGNEWVVILRPGLNQAEAAAVISGLGGKLKKKVYGTAATYVITVDDHTFSPEEAARHPKVESVERNLRFQAFAAPNDPYYTEPYYWNYQMLNLPSAWELQKGGAEVTVAVIDSGVAPAHPDLADNLVFGYDFVDDDDEPWDITYYNAVNRYSHGTHVAGIIGAVTDNGVGVAGVAWNVKIMPIRILGPDGMGSFADAAAGINWAVAHGANIINLSFGDPRVTATDARAAIVVAAIDNAIAKGVTVVAAAGNYVNSVCFPANYDPVIAVAALDETGAVASYSGYGAAVDICAPGGGEPAAATILEWNGQTILSTCYDKQKQTCVYTQMYGTSMAAPHIAGLAALLYSQGITNPATVETVIENTATSLGDASRYGAGKANAYAALFTSTAVINVFYYNLADFASPGPFYRTGSDGSYKIANLTPGSYRVCVFIDNDKDGAVSGGDLAAISAPVSVAAGKTSTVNLTATTLTGIAAVPVNSYFQQLLDGHH